MPTINRQHVNPRRRTTQSAARRNSSSGSSADWKASETFAKINIRGSKGATSSRDRKRLNRIGSFQTFFATHRRLVEGFLRLLTVTNKLLFFFLLIASVGFRPYCVQPSSSTARTGTFFLLLYILPRNSCFFFASEGGSMQIKRSPSIEKLRGGATNKMDDLFFARFV